MAALVVLAWGLLQVPPVARWLFLTGVHVALADPEVRVEVAQVRTDGFRRLDVSDLVIADRGAQVLRVRSARVHYSLPALLAGRLELERLEARGVRVDARADSTAPPLPSAWDWLMGRAWQGLPLHVRALELADVAVRGEPESTMVSIDSLGVRAHDLVLARGRAAVRIDTLTLRSRSAVTAGRWCSVEFAGALERAQLEVRTLRVRGGRTRLDAEGLLALGREHTLPVSSARFRLRAHPLALEDVSALLAQPDARGSLDADAELSGVRLDQLSGNLQALTNGCVIAGVTLGPSRLSSTWRSGAADVNSEGRWQGMPFTLSASGRPFDGDPSGSFEARLAALTRDIPGAPWWPADEPRGLQVSGRASAGRVALRARMDGRHDAIASAGELDLRRAARWVARGVTLARVSLAGEAMPGGRARADSLAWVRTRDGALELYGVTVQDAELARWSGVSQPEAQLRGRVDGRMEFGASARGRLHVRLDASTFAGQPAGPGDVQVAWTRTGVEVAGELAALTGRLEGVVRIPQGADAGVVRLSPVRFANLDLAPWLPAHAHTQLTGECAGTLGPGDAAHASGQLEVRLAESVLAGRALRSAALEASLRAGQLALRSQARLGDDTLASEWTADLTRTPVTWQGTLDVPLALVSSLTAPSVDATGTAHAALAGRGTALATLECTARITAAGAIHGVALDSLQAVLRVAGGVLHADTLDVRMAAGWLAASGRVAAFDSASDVASDLAVRGAVTRGRPLARALGLDSLRVRGGTFAGHVRGPAAALELDATAGFDDVRADAVRARRGRLTFVGRVRPGQAIDRARVHLEVERLLAPALDARSLVADATGDADALAFSARTLFDGAQPARIAGRREHDQLTLDTLTIATASGPWRLTRPARFTTGPGRLEVGSFELGSDSGRVVVRGVLDRARESEGSAELHAVPIDAWTALVGRPELGGRIDATLRWSGTASAPHATGSAAVALRAPWGPVGRLRSEIDWNHERLELDGAFEPRGSVPLSVEAKLPLALSLAAGGALVRDTGESVDVQVTGRGVPLVALGALFDPHVFAPRAGVLDADAHWSGKPGAMRGSGHLDVREGDLGLPSLGARYRGVTVETRVENDGLRIVAAHAGSGKGTVQVTGRVRLPRVDRPEFDLELVARDFRVMQSRDLAAMASGTLRVAGPVSAPEVTGDVSLHDTNVFLTPASGDTSEIELTARDWRMLEDTFGAVTDAPPDLGQRLYASTRFGVQVKLAGDCWVRQRTVPRLEVELRGAFKFDKAAGGQPSLHGSVAPAPERGFVEQFARRFTFTGGDIQLNGPMAEHQLDIKTEYKASSSLASSAPRVVVHLDVQGTFDRLRLLLSSEPAMDQSEIVSYIISGQTARERTNNAATSQRSMAAAIPLQLGLAQIAGPIEELARQKVGLDVVEVRQDGLQGATVVAGRFLDPRLYVGFRQPLAAPARATGGRTKDGTRTRFELEYSAFEWLVLNLQGETSRLRSFVRVSRAY